MEKQKENYDFINPEHYKKFSLEVYEMMIAIWGEEAFMKHCEMCAFKYRLRLGEKPDQPTERDLKKAQWYEDMAIEIRNKLEKENINKCKPLTNLCTDANLNLVDNINNITVTYTPVPTFTNDEKEQINRLI